MKAVAWHGKRDVRVETVPDPRLEEPSDAIVRICTTAICWSDLHLYEVLTPFMTSGDVLGHEPARHRRLASHRLPLEQAPHGYEIFQKKEDGAIKILLHN